LEFCIILRVHVVVKENKMGYQAKVQCISRKDSKWNQWYVNFPNAVAQALNLRKGETIEWEIQTKERIVMVRKKTSKPV